jgi:hypothetical protein
VLVETIKRCLECGCDKPLSGFYCNPNGRFGRHSRCKACLNSKKQSSIARFRAMGADRVPAAKLCPMCRRSLRAGGFSRHAFSGDGLRTYCRDCDRVVRRSNKYGMSRDRVMEMLTQTNCEACGCPLATSSEKNFDHRHSDGAVRGVLCGRCNTTLGLCEENPRILGAISDYMARSKGVDYRFQPYLKQKAMSQDIGSSGPLTPEEPSQT